MITDKNMQLKYYFVDWHIWRACMASEFILVIIHVWYLWLMLIYVNQENEQKASICKQLTPLCFCKVIYLKPKGSLMILDTGLENLVWIVLF